MKQDLIKDTIESYFNLKIKRQTRLREYVEARAFYYKFCRQYTRKSLQDIGESVGRNHASVINGINRLEGWLTYDKRIKSFNDELESILREKFKDIEDDLAFLNAKEMFEFKYIQTKKKYKDLLWKYNFIKEQLSRHQPERVSSGEFDVEEV